VTEVAEARSGETTTPAESLVLPALFGVIGGIAAAFAQAAYDDQPRTAINIGELLADDTPRQAVLVAALAVTFLAPAIPFLFPDLARRFAQAVISPNVLIPRRSTTLTWNDLYESAFAGVFFAGLATGALGAFDLTEQLRPIAWPRGDRFFLQVWGTLTVVTTLAILAGRGSELLRSRSRLVRSSVAVASSAATFASYAWLAELHVGPH
jgi:hypothetical protein